MGRGRSAERLELIEASRRIADESHPITVRGICTALEAVDPIPDRIAEARWALRQLEAQAFAPGASFDPNLSAEIDRHVTILDVLEPAWVGNVTHVA